MRRTAAGLWYRPGDRMILDEVAEVYDSVPVSPGDVVLDLGAHIGSASRLFLDRGAKVIAVECDPANLPLLRLNLRGRAVVIPAAVGEKAGTTPFYRLKGRTYAGSVLPDPKGIRIRVPVVPLEGLLSKFRPSIVKADIEFAEYTLPGLRSLPDFVRAVAMEVHVRYTGRAMAPEVLRERREAAADLMGAFAAQGFRESWRKDKRMKPGAMAAEPDDTGFDPMLRHICVTWVR